MRLLKKKSGGILIEINVYIKSSYCARQALVIHVLDIYSVPCMNITNGNGIYAY